MTVLQRLLQVGHDLVLAGGLRGLNLLKDINEQLTILCRSDNRIGSICRVCIQ